MESYTNRLKEKFGPVITDLPTTSFDPDRFNEHMKDMYPCWEGQTNELQIDGAKNDIENDIRESYNSDSNASSSIKSVSNEYSDTSSDYVPTKRARHLSSELQYGEFNEVSDVILEAIEISSTEGDDYSDFERHLLNEIDENAHEQRTRVQKCINMLNSTNKQKIEVLNNHLDSVKKSEAEWERKYNQLYAQLITVSLERDKVISDAKSALDYRKKIDELTELHAKAIKGMNEAHDREVKELKQQCVVEKTKCLISEYANTEQKLKTSKYIQALKDENFRMEQDLKAQKLEISDLISAQKEQETCIACGDSIKSSRFCSSSCEEIW